MALSNKKRAVILIGVVLAGAIFVIVDYFFLGFGVNEIKIEEEYRVCESDGECVFVQTRCDGCSCYGEPVNRKYKEKLIGKYLITCKFYRGSVCEGYCPTYPLVECINNKCQVLDLEKPAQDIIDCDRIRELEQYNQTDYFYGEAFQCYKEIAKKDADINACLQIPQSYLYVRDRCIREVAIMRNDTAICDLLSEYRENCYFDIIEKVAPYSDASLCGTLENRIRRDDCLDIMARIKEDYKICEMIQHFAQRNTCLLFRATNSQNRSICEKIEDAVVRQYCENSQN